jgi:hypothetical protein
MTRILFLLIIANFNLSVAQNDTCKINKKEMYMKNHNSKFEKQDFSIINQLFSLVEKDKDYRDSLPRQISFPFKGKSLLMKRRLNGTTYYYIKRDSLNNILIKFEFNVSPTGGGIYYREYIDELFQYGETYYSNGNLRSKGINSWLGFQLGKVYKYDEKGNLTETINHDEGYDFTYEKVLEFCKENSIELQSDKIMNRLKKGIIEDGRKVWRIDYNNPKTHKRDIYRLDGCTGEVLLEEVKERRMP